MFCRVLMLDDPSPNGQRRTASNIMTGVTSGADTAQPPNVGFLVFSTSEDTKAFAKEYKHLFVYPSLWGPDALELDACMPACIYPTHVRRYEQITKQSVVPDQCIICMEDFHDRDIVRALPCHAAHVFHSLCVASWVSAYEKSCPVCRHDVRDSRKFTPASYASGNSIPRDPSRKVYAPKPARKSVAEANHYCFLDIDSARNED